MLSIPQRLPAMNFTTVQPTTLRIIASDFDARPMTYIENGERLGYEPAVARAVCAQLGLAPEWFNFRMEDFYKQLSTGEYDVVWFNQAITQDRRAWADFTRPYGLFDAAVLVRHDSTVHTVADLKGKRVGGLADSTNLASAEDFPDVELVPFPGSDQVLPEMLAALHSGRIDALVDDEVVLLAAAEHDSALRIAFTLPSQLPFAIGVLPGNRELLDALNGAITTLMTNRTLQQLWEEWIPQKPFPWLEN